MSTKIVCDGCNKDLAADDVTIEGRRANGMLGGGLPDGDFHWCYRCAGSAFGWLRSLRGLLALGKQLEQASRSMRAVKR